ncbi:MAG: hypothetical protein DCC59_06055 [Chloroflexi bacterium]|nr:hypothetical protein [Anaerolineales bacterium]RIK53798.1 MAG: hypothetical protein DCC59_06055 [Chloroflexota bacterium]
MNKQELLKQADYNFQRGNRELAKKYLSDLLAAYPNDEAAWMLLARVTEAKERKIECFERVLKINPKNEEARLALARVRAALNPTLPLNEIRKIKPPRNPYRGLARGALAAMLAFMLFGTSAYVIARNNPGSPVAQILPMSTANPPAAEIPLPDDVAPDTRAEVGKKYPEYAPLVDALLGYAISNAKNGMDGAPERPGDRILTSDTAGIEAKKMLAASLPQPGSMSTVTITERQITSWLIMEMKNSPDLPLSEVQVYLRDGKVQIWGMVNGSEESTAALAVCELTIGEDQRPYIVIESVQVGQQTIPAVFLSQMEAWLNQALSAEIDAQAPGLALVSVKVTSGMVTVSGTR